MYFVNKHLSSWALLGLYCCRQVITMVHSEKSQRLFQLYNCDQCIYPRLPGVSFISTPRNILSKPLAAFTPNYYLKNSQERQINPFKMTINTRVRIHQPFLRTLLVLFSRFFYSYTHLNVFTNPSQERSLSFSPRFCKFQCNATSDWLNHMV